MPIPTPGQHLPRRGLATAARTVLATTVLVGAVGCGSHDSASAAGDTSVPNLNLTAAKTLSLEANETFGMLAGGVYTVANGDVFGVDSHTGLKLWWIKSPVTPVDPDKIQVLDSGRVLLVGWKDNPGLTAYDSQTGLQMWSTPAAQWFEADDSTGQFVHSDPRTGERRWSVDPATLGCATPLAKDLPALFDTDAVGLTERPSALDDTERPGVDVFRCAAPDGHFVIGGLDRATGATAWHREVPEKGSFRRGPGQKAIVVSGDTIETIDMTDGHSLGSRKTSSDKELRIPQPDGSTLVLDSSTLADDKEMRLLEPDGGTRWTVPLDPKQAAIQPLMTSGGNAILAVLTRSSDYQAWLLAYDPRTGKRTVVIGPGPTAAGEKPALTMDLDITHIQVYPAPWGVLVAGPNNTYATIPAGS